MSYYPQQSGQHWSRGNTSAPTSYQQSQQQQPTLLHIHQQVTPYPHNTTRPKAVYVPNTIHTNDILHFRTQCTQLYHHLIQLRESYNTYNACLAILNNPTNHQADHIQYANTNQYRFLTLCQFHLTAVHNHVDKGMNSFLYKLYQKHSISTVKSDLYSQFQSIQINPEPIENKQHHPDEINTTTMMSDQTTISSSSTAITSSDPMITLLEQISQPKSMSRPVLTNETNGIGDDNKKGKKNIPLNPVSLPFFHHIIGLIENSSLTKHNYMVRPAKLLRQDVIKHQQQFLAENGKTVPIPPLTMTKSSLDNQLIFSATNIKSQNNTFLYPTATANNLNSRDAIPNRHSIVTTVTNTTTNTTTTTTTNQNIPPQNTLLPHQQQTITSSFLPQPANAPATATPTTSRQIHQRKIKLALPTRQSVSNIALTKEANPQLVTALGGKIDKQQIQTVQLHQQPQQQQQQPIPLQQSRKTRNSTTLINKNDPIITELYQLLANQNQLKEKGNFVTIQKATAIVSSILQRSPPYLTRLYRYSHHLQLARRGLLHHYKECVETAIMNKKATTQFENAVKNNRTNKPIQPPTLRTINNNFSQPVPMNELHNYTQQEFQNFVKMIKGNTALNEFTSLSQTNLQMPIAPHFQLLLYTLTILLSHRYISPMKNTICGNDGIVGSGWEAVARSYLISTAEKFHKPLGSHASYDPRTLPTFTHDNVDQHIVNGLSGREIAFYLKTLPLYLLDKVPMDQNTNNNTQQQNTNNIFIHKKKQVSDWYNTLLPIYANHLNLFDMINNTNERVGMIDIKLISTQIASYLNSLTTMTTTTTATSTIKNHTNQIQNNNNTFISSINTSDLTSEQLKQRNKQLTKMFQRTSNSKLQYLFAKQYSQQLSPLVRNILFKSTPSPLNITTKYKYYQHLQHLYQRLIVIFTNTLTTASILYSTIQTSCDIVLIAKTSTYSVPIVTGYQQYVLPYTTLLTLTQTSVTLPTFIKLFNAIFNLPIDIYTYDEFNQIWSDNDDSSIANKSRQKSKQPKGSYINDQIITRQTIIPLFHDESTRTVVCFHAQFHPYDVSAQQHKPTNIQKKSSNKKTIIQSSRSTRHYFKPNPFQLPLIDIVGINVIVPPAYQIFFPLNFSSVFFNLPLYSMMGHNTQNTTLPTSQSLRAFDPVQNTTSNQPIVQSPLSSTTFPSSINYICPLDIAIRATLLSPTMTQQNIHPQFPHFFTPPRTATSPILLPYTSNIITHIQSIGTVPSYTNRPVAALGLTGGALALGHTSSLALPPIFTTIQSALNFSFGQYITGTRPSSDSVTGAFDDYTAYFKKIYKFQTTHQKKKNNIINSTPSSPTSPQQKPYSPYLSLWALTTGYLIPKSVIDYIPFIILCVENCDTFCNPKKSLNMVPIVCNMRDNPLQVTPIDQHVTHLNISLTHLVKVGLDTRDYSNQQQNYQPIGMVQQISANNGIQPSQMARLPIKIGKYSKRVEIFVRIPPTESKNIPSTPSPLPPKTDKNNPHMPKTILYNDLHSYSLDIKLQPFLYRSSPLTVTTATQLYRYQSPPMFDSNKRPERVPTQVQFMLSSTIQQSATPIPSSRRSPVYVNGNISDGYTSIGGAGGMSNGGANNSGSTSNINNSGIIYREFDFIPQFVENYYKKNTVVDRLQRVEQFTSLLIPKNNLNRQNNSLLSSNNSINTNNPINWQTIFENITNLYVPNQFNYVTNSRCSDWVSQYKPKAM